MKKRFSQTLIWLGLGAALFFPSQHANAFIASVKAAGMGQTGVAYAQDAESGAYNPANMVWVGNRYDLGLTTIHQRQQAFIANNPVPGVNGTYDAARKRFFFNPHFGINKMISEDMSVGLVVYNKDASNVKFDRRVPIIGATPPNLNYFQQDFAFIWSWKPHPCHSIGIAFDVLYQDLEVKGLQNLIPISVRPANVTNNGHSNAWGFGATFGWRGDILPCLTVGATFQAKAHMNRFNKYSGFIPQFGRLNSPQVWKLGMAWRMLPCLTYALDYTHVGYSHVRALGNAFSIAAGLGPNDGSGFGWKDTYFIRTGFDWKATECLNLRAGWRYSPTPIRASQATPNLLTMDTIENYLTMGGTYKIDECKELSFYYAHGFRHRINGTGSIPIQLGGGDDDLAQTKDAFGFSLGVYY